MTTFPGDPVPEPVPAPKAQEPQPIPAPIAPPAGPLFELPALPEGKSWRVFANTGADAPEDIHDLGAEPVLDDQKSLTLKSRSVALLVGR